MFVLVRFIQKGSTATKTLFNNFSIKEILTQYRQPLDNDTVRLLAAKMAFDNDAVVIKTWVGKLPTTEDSVLEEDMVPIYKTIG